MPSKDNDSEVMERAGRGRRRASSAPAGGKPTMMQMLWADLRKRPVPSEPSDDELAFIEQEEEALRVSGEVMARAHTLDEAKVDQMRRRYGVG